METQPQPTYRTTFEDRNGTSWNCELDAVLIQAVRDRHNVDLTDIGTAEHWRRLQGDLVLQVDVLYTVLEPQISERGLSTTDFAKAIGPGDVLDTAYNALLDAIELFFPPPRRLLWRRLCDQNAKILARGMQLATEKVSDPALMNQIEEAMGIRMDSETAKQLTRLRNVGDSPAQSE